MDSPKEKRQLPLVAVLMETFGFSPAIASFVTVSLAAILISAIVWVIRSEPPSTIVLTSGPEGSSFYRWALAYQKELATYDVTLKVHPSAGSQENLDRLKDREMRIDIGFVAGGIAKEDDADGLVSLGSVAYQPLFVFYRSNVPLTRLSELAGKRLAVGAVGSGTRSLSSTLLQANGITGAPTTFVDLEAGAAATALLDHQLDAVFLMGDSAPIATLRTLMRAPDVKLYHFTQADAYVRRNAYLNRITLPEGSIDLGTNLPPQDVVLVGPTVELLAREGLNSAVSDLLIEVAQKVHSRSGLLQKRDEFPAPLQHVIPLSDDAKRFYQSGKGFFRRIIPSSFWLANLTNRLLVVLVPLVLVIIPAIRYLPVMYRMSVQLRLYRCYRPLLRVERETYGPITPERAQELQTRVDEIESTVNHLNVPASFADRFYWLRSHIAYVRQRVEKATIT
jgi:TRAP-type uncharacterized transport system substrate-binding protein